jgi:hypothetical protein
MAVMDSDRRGFHIEKSISIGHILTTITLVVAAFSWTSAVDKRLAVHDNQIKQLEIADNKFQDAININRSEILDQLKTLNEKTDKLIMEFKR